MEITKISMGCGPTDHLQLYVSYNNDVMFVVRYESFNVVGTVQSVHSRTAPYEADMKYSPYMGMKWNVHIMSSKGEIAISTTRFKATSIVTLIIYLLNAAYICDKVYIHTMQYIFRVLSSVSIVDNLSGIQVKVW